MEEARVLVVEDEALFSELLRQGLSAEPGLEVVGVAKDGETGVRLAAELKPDSVLMDIELPGELDGIEAALQIKEDRPEVGMVILSSHDDRRYVTSIPFMESPGWGYLLKQTVTDLATLVRAIRGTMDSLVVLDPAVVKALRPRSGSAFGRLTPRQREVLDLMAQGYNNAAIAIQLSLTEKSVETYTYAIYQALQISGEEGVNARVRATLLYLKESQ